MFHISFQMPLLAMSLYGGVMVLILLLLRALLGKHLPKSVFPLLWAVVMLRLLVPVSIASPLALHLPKIDIRNTFDVQTAQAAAIEGTASGLEFPTKIMASETAEIYDTNAVFASGTAAETSFSLIGWLKEQFFYHGGVSLVLLVWAAGVLAAGVFFLLCRMRCCRALNASYSIEHNAVANQALELCHVKGAELYTCDGLNSPLAAGVFHPRIFLPASMDFFNETLLRHIIAHEAMHIRRGDNLFKALMLPILCLHWFNPLVWIMSRELSRDLEAACDEAALSALSASHGDIRQDYACSLLAMAAPGIPSGLFYSAFCKSEVERRIRGVVSFKRWGRKAVAVAALLLACASTAFAVGGNPSFYDDLSPYCVSDSCRFAVQVSLNRELFFDESRQKVEIRATDAILQILTEDYDNPDQLKRQVAETLAGIFGVEPGAFEVQTFLSFSEEELLEQYAAHKISYADGRYSCQGQLIRHFEDQGGGRYASFPDGSLSLFILRDAAGNITKIETFRV